MVDRVRVEVSRLHDFYNHKDEYECIEEDDGTYMEGWIDALDWVMTLIEGGETEL
ncbi:MAG: hypothetical protein WC907_04765 [Acholeplasmataceae bacterium]